MNAAGPAGAGGGGAVLTTDEIIKAVSAYGGRINKDDYSKFMGRLKSDGLTGREAQAERLKTDVPMHYVVAKLQAFQGTPEQMINALKAAGIKKKYLGL